jgi:hypothetical protein
VAGWELAAALQDLGAPRAVIRDAADHDHFDLHADGTYTYAAA